MSLINKNYYELLDVAPTASTEDILRAFRSVRSTWTPGSIAIYSLYTPEEADALRHLVEEAFQVLSDPERRADYDRYLHFVQQPAVTLDSWESFWRVAHAPAEAGQLELEQLPDLTRTLAEASGAEEEGLEAVAVPAALGDRRRVDAAVSSSARAGAGAGLAAGAARRPEVSAPKVPPARAPLAAAAPRLPEDLRRPSSLPRAVTASSGAAGAAVGGAAVGGAAVGGAAGAGTGVAGTGVAGTGVAGTGVAGTGVAGSGSVPARPGNRPNPARQTPASLPAEPESRATMSLPSVRSTPPTPEQPRVSTDSIEQRVALNRPEDMRVNPMRPAMGTRGPMPGAEPDRAPENPTPPETGGERRVEDATRGAGTGWSRSYAAGIKPPQPLPEKPLSREFLEEAESRLGIGGNYLKAIREFKGVSLNDIAAHTKVQTTYLKYLEEERFSDLPPAVYVEGFVNQVARLLKLDVKHTVAGYMRRYYQVVSVGGNGVDGL